VYNKEKNQIENENYHTHSSNCTIDTIIHKYVAILLHVSVSLSHPQGGTQERKTHE